MSKQITFTLTRPIAKEYAPYPALSKLPEWYQAMSNRVPGIAKTKPIKSDGFTVKRCTPVYDALTAGYIVTTWTDVYVSRTDEGLYFEWASAEPIDFHPAAQAIGYPEVKTGDGVPKWMSPWSISTPPGYSCLIVPPMHNPNGIFTCLPAIVDTDTYNEPINFPFVLLKSDYEGLISAGTPIAQVIPFRREDWESSVDLDISHGEELSARSNTYLRSVFLFGYRRLFWSRKSFK